MLCEVYRRVAKIFCGGCIRVKKVQISRGVPGLLWTMFRAYGGERDYRVVKRRGKYSLLADLKL